MKRILSLLLALTMLISLFPVLASAADLTPGDFGWNTDGNNFDGWTVDEAGTTYTVSYNGSNSKRIWKEILSDPQDFTLSFDVQIHNKRIELEILGLKLELNTEGGNGNQVYVKDTDSWLDAADQKVNVNFSRTSGGALTVTYTGNGNDTPLNFTKSARDGSNKNVFFGVIDSGGSATFSNIMLNGSAVEPGEPELPDNPGTPEDPILPPASGKSPADFGWETDNDNYTGWTVDENGTTYTVTYDGVNSKRIWKELITDADNFTVSFDTIVLKQRIEIEIMGIKLELNASGGNGNQLYIKDKDAWMNANGQRASVTLTRENGGDLNVKYVGAGSSTAVTFTKKIYDESNLNVHLGVIDNGGSAVFYNILPVIDIPDDPDTPVDPPVSDKTPADFGWFSDDDNFTGWTADEEGTTFTVTYDGVNSKRIWKQLITNKDNFSISFDAQVLNNRAELELFWTKVELNCSGGNGNQIYIKELDRWMDAQDQKVNVTFSRVSGGDLTITYLGAGAAAPVSFTLPPVNEEDMNLYLGVIDKDGSARFSNIAATEEEIPEEPPVVVKTPADFGWETDNDNYIGWTVNEEGTVFTVTYDGENSKRIWKELIADADNFAIGADVQILNKRAELEILGYKLELNCEGGDGNQIYIKELDSWLSATAQTAHVLIYRQDGGELNIVITGKDNSEAVRYTAAVADASNLNLFIGVIDQGGSASFSNIDPNAEIIVPEDPPVGSTGTPADYGWESDNGNFTGWTMDEEGNSFTVTYDGENSKRMWKELFEDAENFTIGIDVQVLNRRVEIELMGVRFELNTEGGNGNQIYIKDTDSWLDAQEQTIHVTIARRNGGDLMIRYDGKGNEQPMEFSVVPQNPSNLNLHLGVIDHGGSACFSNITASPESYVITWNVDGKVSYEIYHLGETPVYDGSTDKASDENYHYTFTGWDPAIAEVSSDVTYTAVYESKEIGKIYTVTWNVDGTITEETYEEGMIPSYKGSTDKAYDAAYYYVFTGWDPEIAPVTADVTYTAVYEKIAKPSFTDVPENAWYYDSVYRSVKLGFFKGMSANTFEPDSKLTRAMVIVILYRMDGSPDVNGACTFTDVLANSWYDDAVIWGSQNKIVNGLTADTFGPDAPVTREQLVTFLYRYANYKGYDTSSKESIAYFPDSANVSPYALDAMRWAVSVGLITGTKENGKVYLYPYGNATRAQAAAIMVRFYDATHS